MKKRSIPFVILGLVLIGFLGISVQAILSLFSIVTKPNIAVGSIFISVIGLLFIVLIVEIVSAFKIDDSTFHTVLLAGCLIALYLFSTDMQLYLSIFDIHISKIAFGVMSELFFVLIAGCCCWYLIYLYKLSVNRNRLIAVIVSIIALLISYAITLIYGYGYIVHFILVSLIAVMLCILLYKAEKKSSIGLTTYMSTALFCFSLGAQNVNVMSYSGLLLPVLGFSLTYAAFSFLMFVVVYMMFSIHTDSKAVKSNEYKLQAESQKTKALSGQIKPHFIFNSLETVRALYHEDIASGDTAMNLLSDFLRGTINSFDSDLVPFKTELDNLFNYTEFKNLKRKNKIEVIFNIDYTNFSVPPFSIQPFIENALKYSGVDEIENGIVMISSYKKDNHAVVEIIDNGKGFDVSKISEESHGIKNACGRFALALGVVPTIESVLGSGTRIKIVIDLNTEKEDKK